MFWGGAKRAGLDRMSLLAANLTLPDHVQQCHTKRVPVELTADPCLLDFFQRPYPARSEWRPWANSPHSIED